MVQLSVSKAERQGDTGSNPAFSVFFCFFFIISLLLFVFFILFHLFIIIIIIFYAFLIMIFPLLVSGVRVGRLCWVGQKPAVLAAVR